MRVLVYRKTYDQRGRAYDFKHYGKRGEPPELKKARAYNKLLRDHLTAVTQYQPKDSWTLYVEDRNRPHDDNGKQYIRRALESCYVKQVEFVPKQHHELLQLVDVLLGATALVTYQSNRITPKDPPADRKAITANAIVQEIEPHLLPLWWWRPR